MHTCASRAARWAASETQEQVLTTNLKSSRALKRILVYTVRFSLITARVAKVMFSQASVCPTRGGTPNGSWDRSHGGGGPVMGGGGSGHGGGMSTQAQRSTTSPLGQRSTTSPRVKGQPPPPRVKGQPPPTSSTYGNYGQWAGGTHPTFTWSVLAPNYNVSIGKRAQVHRVESIVGGWVVGWVGGECIRG